MALICKPAQVRRFSTCFIVYSGLPFDPEAARRSYFTFLSFGHFSRISVSSAKAYMLRTAVK